MPRRALALGWRAMHRVVHCPHRHIIIGHTLELSGATMALLKADLLANGCLFSGVLILLVSALLSGES